MFLPQTVLAAPDFYGVKMKSEDFARNIMVQENYRTPDFTNERPGTDKRVYAFAYTSTFLGRGRGLSITVHNHSDKPIATDRLFRECIVLTNDGKRYDRSQPEMEWSRNELRAGQEATFNIAFPGVDLQTKDVRMIIFSFGLGETKIFLFPTVAPAPATVASQPAPVAKTKKLELKPKPPEKKVDKKIKAVAKPLSSDKLLAPKKPLTPIRLAQSFFRGMAEKIGQAAHHVTTKTPESTPQVAVRLPSEEAPIAETAQAFEDKKVPVNYPYVKSSQVIQGVTYNFRPNFRTVVQEAEKETVKTVYRDRPWSLDRPDQEMIRQTASRVSSGVMPRSTAQVVVVNPAYVFLVFNAGLEDGVMPNSIVSVLHDGRLVGKAMANKVRDRISAAVILPEWRTKDRIQVGDMVSLAD